MDDLKVGYRDGPDVLKGLSFRVNPGEKVGVVGRTGSGKSTVMLSLLRVLEPRSGTIKIDGVDVSKLEALRLERWLTRVDLDDEARKRVHLVTCAGEVIS